MLPLLPLYLLLNIEVHTDTVRLKHLERVLKRAFCKASTRRPHLSLYFTQCFFKQVKCILSSTLQWMVCIVLLTRYMTCDVTMLGKEENALDLKSSRHAAVAAEWSLLAEY